MTFLSRTYQKVFKRPAPYYLKYSIGKLLLKPIRKWLTNSVASNCPFNCIRILLYRLAGFSIGKHTFIGMHCYLDDLCFDLLRFGNNVTVSYGVYFACHGRKQPHLPIIVEDGAYIGMRASVISKNSERDNHGVVIGKNSFIGACSLVNRDVPEGATVVGVPCRIIHNGGNNIE